MDAARAVVSERVLRMLAALGVLLYYGVGLASLFAGGNFLDYDVLAEDGISGQHLGIFLIELGIGITVATIMVIIFFAFAERGVTR
jgi:multicomponent Na+:H+ antiporter subunit B